MDIDVFLRWKCPEMELTNIYKEGDSFGDQVLLSDGIEKSTLVCDKNTHFMTLSK